MESPETCLTNVLKIVRLSIAALALFLSLPAVRTKGGWVGWDGYANCRDNNTFRRTSLEYPTPSTAPPSLVSQTQYRSQTTRARNPRLPRT